MSGNSEKYRETIEQILEQTKDELWTMPRATLVLLLSAVLGITLIVNLVFFSFGNIFLALLVYAIEAAALIFVLYRHRQHVNAKVGAKISALETSHPGISEAYEKWRGGRP